MEKLVRFDIFCPYCKFKEYLDYKGADPCNDCLACGGRENTRQPLYFKGDPPDWSELDEAD